jgi:hypothetical protein
MLQRIEQCFAEVFSFNVKYILPTIEENVFFSHSSLRWVLVQNPALIGLDLPLATLIGIPRKGKILTCTQRWIKAKLERLCSARLTHRDQKDHNLYMQGFK